MTCNHLTINATKTNGVNGGLSQRGMLVEKAALATIGGRLPAF